MSTNTSRAQKRTDCTDPRPKTIWLGTDATEARHYYRTRSETIHVIDATGEREYVFDVTRESVLREQSTRETLADYMDHVVAKRGWTSKGYSTGTLIEDFLDALEVEG